MRTDWKRRSKVIIQSGKVWKLKDLIKSYLELTPGRSKARKDTSSPNLITAFLKIRTHSHR